jgi:ribosomal protein S18 acetylase RimI-like enzyme
VGVVVIRAGTAADVEAVATIWASGWRDGHLGNVPDALVAARTEQSFHVRAAQRVADTTVALVDDEVVGFTMVTGDEVDQVYVAPAQRGRGAAGVLLLEAARRVHEAGHPVARLAVVPGNTRARAFYEREGWVDTGLFDHAAPTDDEPIPTPCHRYEKTLSPGPGG